MAQSKKKLKPLVMNPLLQACLDRADAQLAQEAAGTAEGSVDIDMQLIGLAEEQAELNELEEQLRQLKDEQKKSEPKKVAFKAPSVFGSIDFASIEKRLAETLKQTLAGQGGSGGMVTLTGGAGGDLSGTYPNPAAVGTSENRLLDRVAQGNETPADVAQLAATEQYVLKNVEQAGKIITCPDGHKPEGASKVSFGWDGYALAPNDCGLDQVPGYEVIAGTAKWHVAVTEMRSREAQLQNAVTNVRGGTMSSAEKRERAIAWERQKKETELVKNQEKQVSTTIKTLMQKVRSRERLSEIVQRSSHRPYRMLAEGIQNASTWTEGDGYLTVTASDGDMRHGGQPFAWDKPVNPGNTEAQRRMAERLWPERKLPALPSDEEMRRAVFGKETGHQKALELARLEYRAAQQVVDEARHMLTNDWWGLSPEEATENCFWWTMGQLRQFQGYLGALKSSDRRQALLSRINKTVALRRQRLTWQHFFPGVSDTVPSNLTNNYARGAAVMDPDDTSLIGAFLTIGQTTMALQSTDRVEVVRETGLPDPCDLFANAQRITAPYLLQGHDQVKVFLNGVEITDRPVKLVDVRRGIIWYAPDPSAPRPQRLADISTVGVGYAGNNVVRTPPTDALDGMRTHDAIAYLAEACGLPAQAVLEPYAFAKANDPIPPPKPSVWQERQRGARLELDTVVDAPKRERRLVRKELSEE
jgi:hypothetical protein